MLRAIMLIPLLTLFLWGATAATAMDRLDGSLQNPGSAERHPDNRLPPNAIDTGSLPRIVIDADAPDHRPLPYYRLAPDTYFLYGNIAQVNERNRGFNGNAGFVVTPEGVVVIDSLGTPALARRLIATIRQVTDQPIRYLILTHSHPDHAYGAAAFRELDDEVTVIGHPGILDYLGSEVIRESADYRRDILGADMRGFEGVRPDLLIDRPRLDEPHTLELGGQRFEIFNAGKHHSYGDLVVHQAGQRIVWISDLAFNQRTTYMGDGNSKQAIEGQDWLLERFSDARLMVPGHGSAQTAPFPMVEKTRAYIQRLRDEMAAAIENGLTLSEAVEQSHFPEWEDSRLYEENHRRNANFVYLEMEMALF
ncbi:MBL fold metallo-hydrolase [Thiohalobacter thiocyanaticus]|uniref:MBL fold metallo-hydrolase n=1 Tax=Thiohalobacter thiocyanaticus TaxID=585455 RepID=A0A426QHC6_9GAMM|nr:MBL fold metallo-hydrolase [Thiohalobacter thiocyanaticus]RRQ21159.1 MBL fold metallo-hydrolase [Thiohalobacter thiocyanaticus]